MTKERGKRKILFFICVMASLVMTLCCSRLFSEGARRGIELSAEKLIPSLFPSMVIAELAVGSSLGEAMARPISKPLSKMFNISRAAVVPFMLGMIFGFPVSVRAAVALYSEGKIDESELCRLALFSVIPSPAFFISAVGEGLFGSLKFGAFLYASAVLCCFVTGIAVRGLFASVRGRYYCENFARKKKDISFVSAVTSSARSLFVICSFVVFFSAFLEPLSALLSELALPQRGDVLVLGAFEMTSGVSLASSLGADGAPISAAILGFSGVSVLCQLVAIDSTKKIKIAPCVIARLFFAIFMFLLSLGFLSVFGKGMLSSPSAPSFILYSNDRLSLSILALFFCSFFMALCESKRKNFGKTIYKR